MKTTQTWKIGDCLDLLPGIETGSINMILTDLPYGITTCSWDVIIPLKSLWKQYKRIIKNDGTIVLTASQPFTSVLIMSNIEMFKYEWIWDKGIGTNPLLANKQPIKSHENICVFQKNHHEITKDLTTFKELREYALKLRNHIGYSRKKMIKMIGDESSQHFLEPFGPQWSLCTHDTYKKIVDCFHLDEWCDFLEYDFLKNLYSQKTFNLQKTRGKPYMSISGKANMPHLNSLESHKTINRGGRFPKTILKISPSRGLHPTQKPVKLFEYLIKTYTNEGDTVHDSCLGSGTTLEACRLTNRNCIGFEISDDWEKYYPSRILAHNKTISEWF